MSMAFQYQEKKSFMHDMDPLSKIVWMVCISVLVFIYETALPQVALFFLILMTAFLFARLSPKFVLRGIWIMLIFSIGFFILQVLLVPGNKVLFSLGPLPIYMESVDFATAITFRILTIFTSSLVFVATSDPRDIVISLTQQLKIPYRYAYSIFVALRFVPTLESEARIIEAAQTIRGVGKQKGLKNKAENLKRFSLPLLMGALRRVRVTANTMEARGYGAYSDRTYIRTLKISKKGIVFVLIWVALTIYLIALKSM
ncbi:MULTISPECIES: energy-coupling factor transporter transmembrane component T [Neobacillus]|jgi:energy-coupling factor transport system permease protein|uniref:energy-coupling factor transporter transmembrane component T family protein n=1 Tax=Neobacillus TaxID=2675232 RepID=UPI002E248EC8|nr:energy-coupling factor transporter transmembrane component T [Neobacillus thermocopriae]MED3713405.1 energy-coupling factor transporter transmembrane component T [Neobacillus thermocopriae]